MTNNTIPLLRWTTGAGRKVWTLQLAFEPRDVWVGLFWEYADFEYIHTVCHRWFLCLVPLLPLILTMQRTYTKGEWQKHAKAAADRKELVKEYVDVGSCTVREHAGLERVVHKINMGEKLLPDPELGQDVAFLAFVIQKESDRS